jgi:threonine/homoserine/homoserine lactone efflux protein
VDTPLFIRGFLIGLAIAAPVGPIGVLRIQHTLTEGRIHGLVSRLGAATADALYGSVAIFAVVVLVCLVARCCGRAGGCSVPLPGFSPDGWFPG